MSFLLYGIVANTAQFTLAAELQLIKTHRLAAVVAPCGTTISREPDKVLAYGKHIAHIHQQTTLIPVRYGSVLSDASAVITHLQSQQAHYSNRLMLLHDCEEMGIRIVLDAQATSDSSTNPVPRPPESGHAYLLARKQAYAIPEQATQQAALLNHSLAGLYRQQQEELSLFNGQHTYLLSYLVARTELATFCRQFYRLADDIKNSFISGPWPPYHFAN